MGVAWRNVSTYPTWNEYGFILYLATFQEGNTSLKTHNWLSSLASKGSVINSVRAELGAKKVCLLAYRRWFASTSCSCFLWPFSSCYCSGIWTHSGHAYRPSAHTAKQHYWVTVALPNRSDLGSKAA